MRDLPTRIWSVIPASPNETLVVEPPLVKVRPGEATREFRIVDLGRFESVEIDVVSAVSGESLPLARVVVFKTPSTGEPVDRSHGGALRPVPMPFDAETMIYATAPGYRMAEVAHRPSVDGERVTVRLREGWSSYVDVWNSTRFERLSGIEVLVDGVSTGRTDENGRLWLEADRPPQHISVNPGEFELAVDPMKDEPEEAMTSPFGVTFGLREK